MTTELATADPGLLAHEELVGEPARKHGAAGRGSARRTWTALLALALVWSLARSGVGRGDAVNEGGWALVGRFVDAAVHPELSGRFLRLTWDATLTTLSYAVLGTALSVAIGAVLGVAVSETWWRGATPAVAAGRTGAGGRRARGWVAAQGALSFPRGVHEAVWGLFLVRVLGLDPLVGVLAIAVPYGAVTAKVYAELLDETPGRAFAALRGAGAGRLKALCYALAPQALPDMVSYAFYRFECSIRAATILGIIGAGGLGFQLALSFQSLRYGEMWTLIYALVIMSGLVEWWSTALRRRTRGAPEQAGHDAVVGGGAVPTRDRFLIGSAVAVALLVVVSARHLEIDITSLWGKRPLLLASDIARASWPPDVDSRALRTLARLSLETLEMSVVAIAVASLGGMAFALVAANRSRRWAARTVATVARVLLVFLRAVPPPVWALLFLFVLFPGPMPGALALGVYNLGILGRLMAEVLDNLDDRPVRALRAHGTPGPQLVLYGVMPAALPRFVAYTVYRWEVTLRETVVVGLVGAGGLGRLLSSQLASFDYRGVAATLAALVLLTFAADLIGSAVRRALR